MKRSKYKRLCYPLAVLVLTGCPQGDRLESPETANVSATSNGICFQVKDAEIYHPVIISIAPRGTSEEGRWYKDKPDLDIVNDELCIPAAFYPFTEHKEYVVDYNLAPKQKKSERFGRRRVMAGFKIINGHVYSIPLKPFEH